MQNIVNCRRLFVLVFELCLIVGIAKARTDQLFFFDSLSNYMLYGKIEDSTIALTIVYRYENSCIYDQGLCIKSIRIDFSFVSDTVECVRRAFAYVPDHGIIGVVYKCIMDTSLFIYVNMSVDSIEHTNCNSFSDLARDILGDSIIDQKEKACKFLADKYKLMSIKKCSLKIYDSLLTKKGFYMLDMYGLVLILNCFSVLMLSQSDELITYISDNVQVHIDFKFCE